MHRQVVPPPTGDQAPTFELSRELDIPTAAPDHTVEALISGAFAHGQLGGHQAEIADWFAALKALDIPDAPPDSVSLRRT